MDATATVLAIHAGVTTDFTPRQYSERIGADYNDNLVHEHYGKAFYLGHTGNTQYFSHRVSLSSGSNSLALVKRKIFQNPSEVMSFHRGLHLAHGDAGTESNTFVQLLVVDPGKWEDALKLGCIASTHSDHESHFIFLTVESESYNRLKNVYPDSVLLESDSEPGKTMVTLLQDMATVVLTNVSAPHWSSSRVDDAARFREIVQNHIGVCDATTFNDSIVSIRPTTYGLNLAHAIKMCLADDTRNRFVNSVASLRPTERSIFLSSPRACQKGYLKGYLHTNAFPGIRGGLICNLEGHLQSPQPIPSTLIRGRTWEWDPKRKRCSTFTSGTDSSQAGLRPPFHGSSIGKASGADSTPLQERIRTVVGSRFPVKNVILHCVVAVANPCGLKSRYELARATIERIERRNADSVRVHVVELAYGNQSFVVTQENHSRHLQLRAEVPMWHKENLINLAVARLLPRDWQAMAWIDGDVEFDSPTWALDALKLLKGGFDVVQLFSHALFMDALGNTLRFYSGYGYNFVRGRTYTGEGSDAWHPGFGWAYSRKAFEQAGGMFEYELSGHGDGVIAHCMMGGFDWNTYWIPFSSDGHRDAVLAYNSSCAGLQMGYTPGVVRHYFHGTYESRKYLERRQIYNDFKFDPLLDLRHDDVSGVLLPTSTFPTGLMEQMVDHECLDKKGDDGDLSLFLLS